VAVQIPIVVTENYRTEMRIFFPQLIEDEKNIRRPVANRSYLPVIADPLTISGRRLDARTRDMTRF